MIDEYLFYDCEIVEDDDDAPEGNLVQSADVNTNDNSEDDLFFEIVNDEQDTAQEEAPKKKESKFFNKKAKKEHNVEPTKAAVINESPIAEDNSETTTTSKKHKDKCKEYNKPLVTEDKQDNNTSDIATTKVEEAKPSKKSAKLVEQQPVEQEIEYAKTVVTIKPTPQPKQQNTQGAQKAQKAKTTQTEKPAAQETKSATKTASKSKATIKAEEENTLPAEGEHIRTGLRVLSKANNLQNVLGGSSFEIDTTNKTPQKTVSTAKKFEDPWAVAKLNASPDTAQNSLSEPKAKAAKKNTTASKKSN